MSIVEYKVIKNKLPSVSNWLTPNYKTQGYTYQDKLIEELKIGGYENPTNWKVDHSEYNWVLDQFIELRNGLINTLKILDEINDVPELNKLYHDASDKARPYYLLKGQHGILIQEYGAEVVSNAWLKMYEMGKYLEKIFTNMNKKQRSSTIFKSFHIAEAPGNFMLAINHWLYNHHPEIKWEWTANSYRELYDSSSNYLVDTYGLIKTYPEQWNWGVDGDGDITSSNNIRSFGLDDKSQLATGDVKYVPYKMDYSKEENINIPVVFGQFLSSLWVLKKDGILINKMFTIYEPATICMIYIGTCVFEEFQIVKPATSRPANTEIYIIGTGYKDNLTVLEKNMLLIYMEYIRNLNTGVDVPPLFKLEDLDEEFIRNIYDISNSLYTTQIENFNEVMRLYEEIQKSDITSVLHRLEKPYEQRAREWIASVGIGELPNHLHMRK